MSLLRRGVKRFLKNRCFYGVKGLLANAETYFFAFVKSFLVSYVRARPTASVGSLNYVPSLWFHSSQIAQA